MKFTIRASATEALRSELTRLQNKANKSACSSVPLSVEFGPVYEKRIFVTHNDGTREAFDIPVRDVEANFEDMHSKFRLIARLQVTGNQTIIYEVPGETLPEERRHLFVCEHCNTNRKRKDFYALVETATGRHMQVGKSCLKDAMGAFPGLLAHASSLDFMRKLIEDYGPGDSQRQEWTLTRFLTAVSQVVSEDMAWRPVAFENTSSASKALKILQQPMLYPPSDDPKFAEQARQIIEFIKSSDFVADTTFASNLKVLAEENVVTSKSINFASAMFSTWQKCKGIEFTEEAEKPSEHIGEVGGKFDAVVTLERISEYSGGRFGGGYVVALKTLDGNKIVWFTSSQPEWLRKMADEEITEQRISATVKSHGTNEYRGVKTNQTVVKRVISK